LRDGKDAVPVNWIGFEISDAKGAVKYKTAVVTSLPVTKANVTVHIPPPFKRRLLRGLWAG
jgi:hypothetical protein